jgi:hypothetical protein
MPLRLFGWQGTGKYRSCPACEQKIAADATFCPFCYMVIRAEGAADLREHLQGGRIPSDVYLLRKMQVEDGNTGPVLLHSAEPIVADSSPPPPSAQPDPAAPDPGPAPAPEADPPQLSIPAVGEPGPPPPPRSVTPVRSPQWKGIFSFFKFEAPLPPATASIDDLPALLRWMLERDPLIPNNLERLETLHAAVFPAGPAVGLGYEQHLLLQIQDDLLLHATQEPLDTHLAQLSATYRHAAATYHAAADKEGTEANAALWQMSSLASRLRVEAWVYRSRYDARPGASRLRRPRTSGD